MSDERSIIQMLGNVVRGHENIFDVIHSQPTDEEGKPMAPETRLVLQEKIVAPERQESPKRAHVFQEIGGFIAYLKKYGGNDTVILANADEFNMTACLNETAEEGFEWVRYEPVIHPLIRPWVGIFNKWHNVDDFAQFVLCNRRVIENGRDLAMTLSQIRSSIKTEIQKGIGKKSVNGVMTTIEVSGVQQQEPVDLPDTIVIECPIYMGTDYLEIELDLVISGTAEGVMVMLGDADCQVKRVRAFEGFVEEVEKSGLMASLGRAAVAQWNYIGR